VPDAIQILLTAIVVTQSDSSTTSSVSSSATVPLFFLSAAFSFYAMTRSAVVVTPLSLLLVILCAQAVAPANAINFDVGPGREECFFEDVHAGTNINGVYAVTEGSHLDIDVGVWTPDGHEIYSAAREGDGKFMIKAETDGTYKFCFSNKMSMVSHKNVKLVLTTGEPLDISKLAKKESMDNVERWIVSISHTVRMIDFHQQEYRMLHERHLNTVTATNRRVKWWSFLECIAVMAVSALQVFFVKRLFSKSSLGGPRRMV
jgi:p24 family protein beta-1